MIISTCTNKFGQRDVWVPIWETLETSDGTFPSVAPALSNIILPKVSLVPIFITFRKPLKHVFPATNLETLAIGTLYVGCIICFLTFVGLVLYMFKLLIIGFCIDLLVDFIVCCSDLMWDGQPYNFKDGRMDVFLLLNVEKLQFEQKQKKPTPYWLECK